MLLTKKKFCEYINFIKERQDSELRVCKALNDEFIDANIFFYSKYESKLVELLKIIMQDKGDWIDYFIYELDFGKKWKVGTVTEKDGTSIDISDAEKLYDFLIRA